MYKLLLPKYKGPRELTAVVPFDIALEREEKNYNHFEVPPLPMCLGYSI